MDIKQIFIVTSGCYSDYSIRAVFSTKEAAERYCQFHSPVDYDFDKHQVEVWDVDTDDVVLPVGKQAYEVVLSRDGVYSATHAVSYDRERDGRGHVEFYPAGTHWPAWAPSEMANQQFMHTYALARDEQHAVKIVAERRAWLLATNQWPPPGEAQRNGYAQSMETYKWPDTCE
jgi:virulence-associated protein VagC